MPTDFQQTDTASVCVLDPYCSGNSDNGDEESNQGEVGGTAGSTELTVTMDASGVGLNAVWMELIGIDDYDGGAGDWDIRLSITTADSKITLEEIHVCRLNSSCANQESIVSVTSLGDPVSLVETKLHTINQGSSITVDAGDKFMVVFAFDTGFSMARSFGYTPSVITRAPGTIVTPTGDELIDTRRTMIIPARLY